MGGLCPPGGHRNTQWVRRATKIPFTLVRGKGNLVLLAPLCWAPQPWAPQPLHQISDVTPFCSPPAFRDVQKWVQSVLVCQRAGGPEALVTGIQGPRGGRVGPGEAVPATSEAESQPRLSPQDCCEQPP